eukprot:1637296-Amphidinium_carterae.1
MTVQLLWLRSQTVSPPSRCSGAVSPPSEYVRTDYTSHAIRPLVVCNKINIYRHGGSTAMVSQIFQNLQRTTTFRIVA